MPEKQQRLKGVGAEQIAEIEEAAEELRGLRKQRQELSELEEKAQVHLTELLKKHGLKKYLYESDEGEKPVKYDVLLERPEARAYVRKHKEKKKASGEEAEKEEQAE